MVIALTALIPVVVAGFIAVLRELRRVKHLVNSHLDHIMGRLDDMTSERDRGRVEIARLTDEKGTSDE